MKRREIGRRLERHADGFAFGHEAHQFGDAVDMAGDDMAAELVADFIGPFEIDRIANFPVAQRRLRQGFARGRDREPAILRRALVDHRHAGARAGDRGAHLDGRDIVMGRDHDMRVAALFDVPDLADIGDNSREHGVPFRLWPR